MTQFILDVYTIFFIVWMSCLALIASSTLFFVVMFKALSTIVNLFLEKR